MVNTGIHTGNQDLASISTPAPLIVKYFMEQWAIFPRSCCFFRHVTKPAIQADIVAWTD